MDAVLKLCLDTTDVERAFDEIDERLRSYSDDSAPSSGKSQEESDSSLSASIDDSELLNRIHSELEALSSITEGLAETALNLAEIMNGVRQSLENSTFIQGVTAV